MRKAAAPITGGMIWPLTEEATSTAPDFSRENPTRRIRGTVKVPVVTTLEEPTEESLIRILIEPKNALIKQYQKLFALDNTHLTFTDEALRLIAKVTLEQKSGARGLRAVLEKVMLDLMYECPSDHEATHIEIDLHHIEKYFPHVSHDIQPPISSAS